LRINPLLGSYTSDGTSLDPLTRFYSYQRSEKYGYLVNVGLSVSAEMHALNQQFAVIVALVTIFSAVVLGLAFQINHSRRRMQGVLLRLAQSHRHLEMQNDHITQAEARHRDLLAKLHTGVVVHAPDTHILFSNPSAAQLLGLTPDQLSGKTTIDPAWHFVDEAGNTLAPADYPVSRVIATMSPIDAMVVGVKVPEQLRLVWLLVSDFQNLKAVVNSNRSSSTFMTLQACVRPTNVGVSLWRARGTACGTMTRKPRWRCTPAAMSRCWASLPVN
jgi:PAS domain-containing protein